MHLLKALVCGSLANCIVPWLCICTTGDVIDMSCDNLHTYKAIKKATVLVRDSCTKLAKYRFVKTKVKTKPSPKPTPASKW